MHLLPFQPQFLELLEVAWRDSNINMLAVMTPPIILDVPFQHLQHVVRFALGIDAERLEAFVRFGAIPRQDSGPQSKGEQREEMKQHDWKDCFGIDTCWLGVRSMLMFIWQSCLRPSNAEIHSSLYLVLPP